MKGFDIVGKDRLILDGKEKVTGEAKYCADIFLPNMLYGGFLRSKYPHARIININKNRAERLKGVKGIITGDDIPEDYFHDEALSLEPEGLECPPHLWQLMCRVNLHQALLGQKARH